MFLTLTQIKKHLNLESTFTEDDEYLTLLAESAEAMVQKHIDNKFEYLVDSEGNLPKPLLSAMLLFIGNLYANRESVAYAQTSQVPKSYDYLLDAYRNYLGVEYINTKEPIVYYGCDTIPTTAAEIKNGSKMYASTTITPSDTTRAIWIAYLTANKNYVSATTSLNKYTSVVGDYTVDKYFLFGGYLITDNVEVTIK